MWHTPRFPGRILVSPRDRGPTGSRRSSRRSRSAIFRLEALEGRALLSTVTSLLDDGTSGTLRQTIANAPAGDTITFDSTLFSSGLPQTITLNQSPGYGELNITKKLDIEGPGAGLLTVSGDDASRVFDIQSGTVTIAGLTITDGLADGNAPIIHSVGGGILNQGNLTLKHVVVSDNLAEGATNDTIYVNSLPLSGDSIGGGVANLGTLAVSDSTFTDNQARGASGSSDGFGSFPGGAFGGGLANGGKTATATVTDCQFTSNLARGGNFCLSSVPGNATGDATGGAIANYAFGVLASPGSATLSVRGSSFSNNQAIAGDGNRSATFPGHAVGGAIASHRLLNLGGSASLDVSDSTFDHNESIGGSHNVALPGSPDPTRVSPNSAVGGGIFAFGTGTISDSTFDHNGSIGGQGLAGSDGLPITVNGGDAWGGGIDVAFPTNVVTVSNCTVEHNSAIAGQAGAGGTGGNARGGGVSNSLAGSRLTVTGSIIDHNQALGGHADTSGSASHGGEGAGGGVYNVPGSTTNVIASSIAHNLAIGGAGSNGGNGGDGLGGGFYSSGTAYLMGSIIEYNLALGGEAGSGGSDGKGIGGGVYLLGTFTIDSTTVIKKNHASTSHDDIGP